MQKMPSPDPVDLVQMAQNLQLLRRQFTEPDQPEQQSYPAEAEDLPTHDEFSSYPFRHRPSASSSPAPYDSPLSSTNRTTPAALRDLYQEYLQAHPLPQPHE